jgi:hypothetical protein
LAPRHGEQAIWPVNNYDDVLSMRSEEYQQKLQTAMNWVSAVVAAVIQLPADKDVSRRDSWNPLRSNG